MLPRLSCVCSLTRSSFNPHPARKPDATLNGELGMLELKGFNPHPARKPDATSNQANLNQAYYCFNPHPARKPDATLPLAIPPFLLKKFQSSPGPKAGCYLVLVARTSLYAKSFNPHPARKPDATWSFLICLYAHQSFNPHPARKPDATLLTTETYF